MEKRDVTLKLGGEEYTLTPSFRALADISAKVGDPTHIILRSQTMGQPPSFTQMLKVLHLGLKASGYSLTEEEVGELLFEGGYAEYYEPFGEFLGLLTNGGRAMEEEGNRAQRRAGKRATKSKAKAQKPAAS